MKNEVKTVQETARKHWRPCVLRILDQQSCWHTYIYESVISRRNGTEPWRIQSAWSVSLAGNVKVSYISEGWRLQILSLWRKEGKIFLSSGPSRAFTPVVGREWFSGVMADCHCVEGLSHCRNDLEVRRKPIKLFNRCGGSFNKISS